MSISFLLITFVIFSVACFPSCFSADQQYEECRLPLRCGSGPSVFPNITYPFWGDNIGKPNFCGQTEYELSCQENQNLTLEIKNLTLRVVSANLSDKTITVADESLLDGVCSDIWSFNGDDHFGLSPKTEYIDLFDCLGNHTPTSSLATISCLASNEGQRIYHVFGSSNLPLNCSKVGEIPMLGSAKNALLQSNDSKQALRIALEKGFEMRYSIQDEICRDCTDSSGICGSDSGSEIFRCLCLDKPHKSSCNDGQGRSTGLIRAGIGFASGLLFIILIAFISSNPSMNMDWMVLYGIALGVARALREERKHMSLLDTRGTIGYIAPEVFSRMYGRVSHKSDVYSYGMLVLEMIGARNKERADQTSASNASSMYFPEWIYKDLEKRDNERPTENGISSDERGNKEDDTSRLWCIQTSIRSPSMNRVGDDGRKC
ncbi:unnamed protein product [Microthlaspi erraticum]|uniref:non-specific serine/threonine protein kinase n=1 Tax=Microthlaspi erraticum TaxID=1685480 RepID=A0A6D2KAC1_9BRAS|nr:unnamed protein product [Microthlaspi erraticum]